MYTYKQEGNVYTLREYKNNIYFEICFSIGRIKTKTIETEINPLKGEETVSPYYYEKMFNKLLYKYRFV